MADLVVKGRPRMMIAMAEKMATKHENKSIRRARGDFIRPLVTYHRFSLRLSEGERMGRQLKAVRAEHRKQASTSTISIKKVRIRSAALGITSLREMALLR